MNHCLANKQTIQWNTIFEQYCSRCGVYGKALAIQYARTGTCKVEGDYMVIDEEFVEIAQGKLKPVEGTQVKGVGKLPGAGKYEVRAQIAMDWECLNQMLDDYENGLSDTQHV